MSSDKTRFIIANITWNETGWRNIYVNPKAGHRYVQESPGHESLNFDFNKKNLDTDTDVFGYVQWTGVPRRFEEKGVVFFYSKNLESNKGEIVGVYCNVKILDPPRKVTWEGFENNELIANIMADKSMSSLFPVPLDSKKYSTERLVPQAGLKYVELDLARQIITDEIDKLKQSGITKDEFNKFTNIFEFITREKFDNGRYVSKDEIDEVEQQEIQKMIPDTVTKGDILRELKSLNPKMPQEIVFSGKTFKRDNKTITYLKRLRDFKCQICGIKIPKKDRGFYIEAAHITRKSEHGLETPKNILILCPNHHKEFDYGDLKIIERSKRLLVVRV